MSLFTAISIPIAPTQSWPMTAKVLGWRLGIWLTQGHRRIAYISGPADWDASQLRLQGYQEELTARGLPYDEQLVMVGSWEVENGQQAVQQLLTLPDPPTAVFAGNDVIALGAIHGAQDMGLQVPRDLAVVGYDAQEFTGFFRPSITTVSLPCHEMGIASAELLLRLMNGEIQSSEPIEVPGQLIVRESCGPSLFVKRRQHVSVSNPPQISAAGKLQEVRSQLSGLTTPSVIKIHVLPKFSIQARRRL